MKCEKDMMMMMMTSAFLLNALTQNQLRAQYSCQTQTTPDHATGANVAPFTFLASRVATVTT
jgi:hypothetical protein